MLRSPASELFRLSSENGGDGNRRIGKGSEDEREKGPQQMIWEDNRILKKSNKRKGKGLYLNEYNLYSILFSDYFAGSY